MSKRKEDEEFEYTNVIFSTRVSYTTMEMNGKVGSFLDASYGRIYIDTMCVVAMFFFMSIIFVSISLNNSIFAQQTIFCTLSL